MADKTRGRKGLSINVLSRLRLLPSQNDGNLSDREHPSGTDMSYGSWDGTSDSESGESGDCLPTVFMSTCMLITHTHTFFLD